MKAFVVDKYKKKGALRLANVPEPELRDDDVLVRIHATGCEPSGLQGQGRRVQAHSSAIVRPSFWGTMLPGQSSGLAPRSGGSRRATRSMHGRAIIGSEHSRNSLRSNEADVALKPKNLSMEEAASIPLVGLTAWQALVEVGKVKPGQKVFIQAGSGGVGTFAIQLAKHLGATVATTTSTKNVELVKSLGADVVIDYKTQDFEKVLSGYDLVLNSQDAKTLEKSLRVLKPGGLLISISGPPDPEFAKELGLNLFLKLVMRLLSRGVRKKAKSLGVRYLIPVHACAGAAVE